MPEAPVKVGEVLSGKFKVERILGMGGMGVVVAARHLQLEQRVALKFMLPEALTSQESIERFLREARAVARLKSDHIARVLDVGTLDTGAPYIVMELLEGKDVATLMDHGPLPIGQAAGIIVHACAAVAEAHAVNIIHRDLKPRNLFLTEDVEGKPLVKVLDFGISKDLGDGSGDMSNTPSSLTKTSMMLGSPHYMSPEQLRSSRDVDARADVWSLGVCLYELLARKTPFEAPSIAELCVIVLAQDPPSLRQLRPDVPPELEAVIMRCLKKNTAERYPSVVDLATALAPFADAWAKPAVERARNVMRNSRQTSHITSGIAAAASPSAPTIATNPTVASWEAEGGKPSSRLPLILGGVIAALAAVAGAVVAVVVSLRHEEPKVAPAVTVVQVVSAPLVSATASTPPQATASSQVVASASAAPSSKPARPMAPKQPTIKATKSEEDQILEGRN